MDLAGVDEFMAIFGFHRVQEDNMSTQTGMKPVANYRDIIDTFEDLIEANGTTTTLDVKRDLRAGGFWVKQSDVSEALDAMLDDEDGDRYTFTINRNHRVYRLADDDAIIPIPTVARVQVRAKKIPSVGSWDVTDGIERSTYRNMTRNQARYAFSKDFDVPYINTRAYVAAVTP